MWNKKEQSGKQEQSALKSKKGRKRQKNRSRGNSTSSDTSPEDNCIMPKSPEEGYVPEQLYQEPNMSSATSSMKRRKSSSKKKIKLTSHEDVNTEIIHDCDQQQSVQQEEIKYYMNKLRNLIPQSNSEGKTAGKQILQNVIQHICQLQTSLQNHPGLKGLDPRVLAAPGSNVNPIERQREHLRQRNFQEQLNQQDSHHVSSSNKSPIRKRHEHSKQRHSQDQKHERKHKLYHDECNQLYHTDHCHASCCKNEEMPSSNCIDPRQNIYSYNSKREYNSRTSSQIEAKLSRGAHSIPTRRRKKIDTGDSMLY